ncbi:methyltransferase [Teratosphaeria destructans]|uniref:Methyltransferase n=1 Tax=Teratosphaeria destructans TaxID=418781 RepID=A0A9W7SSL8_9PEZI|nr:methyltransferase [Teratosphaeria destructans]
MPLLIDTHRHDGRPIVTRRTMHRCEDERTYHVNTGGGDGQSKETKQSNHESIFHHLCLVTLQGCLYLAPIGSSPRRLLDIGTGTGSWATGVAERYPNAAVIGADRSPVAQTRVQPSNLVFTIKDCCSEWTYPQNHFDLIHIRGLSGSISDWPSLYRRAHRHLQPGGWIEQLECSIHLRSTDGTLSTNKALRRWSEHAIRLGMLTGKTFELAENMAGLIREAGFVDVTEKRFKWPVGAWSSEGREKEVGKWNLLRWEDGMESWMAEGHGAILGHSAAQVRAMLEEVRAALRSGKVKVYHEVRDEMRDINGGTVNEFEIRVNIKSQRGQSSTCVRNSSAINGSSVDADEVKVKGVRIGECRVKFINIGEIKSEVVNSIPVSEHQ